jgi:hypothetical protein
MIVQGSVSPQKIWIRYIDENNNAIIRLTRNIVEKDIDNGFGETFHIFEYEEIEINIQNRDNLEQYITANFDLLFEKGLSDYKNQKDLKEKQQQINNLIDNNNFGLLTLNDETKSTLNTLLLGLMDAYDQILKLTTPTS